jgi:anti-sigma factor RsiW
MTNHRAGTIALETLVAYVDSELDSEEMARVAAALATDADSQRIVRALCETGTMAADAYNDILTAPVPARLVAAATGGHSSADLSNRSLPIRRAATNDNWRKWAMSAAAAVAMLILGFSGGRWVADRDPGADLAPAGASATGGLDDPAALGALHALLADAPEAGRSQAYADGTLVLGPSFELAGGRICWQFHREPADGTAIEGLACPDDGSVAVLMLGPRDEMP